MRNLFGDFLQHVETIAAPRRRDTRQQKRISGTKKFEKKFYVATIAETTRKVAAAVKVMQGEITDSFFNRNNFYSRNIFFCSFVSQICFIFSLVLHNSKPKILVRPTNPSLVRHLKGFQGIQGQIFQKSFLMYWSIIY